MTRLPSRGSSHRLTRLPLGLGVTGVDEEGSGSNPGGVTVGLVSGAEVGLINAGGLAGVVVVVIGAGVVVFGSRATSTAFTVFGLAGAAINVAPGFTTPLGGEALNFTLLERELAFCEAMAVMEVGELFDSTMRIGSSLLDRSRGGVAASSFAPVPQVSVERASTGAGVNLPGIRMPRYGS